jgi:diphthamide synthase (EF-2-diphthine--ammonia ligase)
MIKSGLRAKLTCVDPKCLAPEFVGREFDERLLSELPLGIDPCGENGEFHTFVYVLIFANSWKRVRCCGQQLTRKIGDDFASTNQRTIRVGA